MPKTCNPTASLHLANRRSSSLASGLAADRPPGLALKVDVGANGGGAWRTRHNNDAHPIRLLRRVGPTMASSSLSSGHVWPYRKRRLKFEPELRCYTAQNN